MTGVSRPRYAPLGAGAVRQWQAGADSARALLRPDGRWVLKLPVDPRTWPALLTHRPQDLGALLISLPDQLGEDQQRILRQTGFLPSRTDQVWRIPVDRLPSGPITSHTHRLLPVTECDPARVVGLDDIVRQQIPGCHGWTGTVADLRASLDDDFDPRLYLIAEHRQGGSYDGLIRVWAKRPRPRLGCIGVTPAWRRTRLAPVLLCAVTTLLRDRGIEEIEAETDITNQDSYLLAQNHGGTRHARTTEWVLRP